MNFFILATCLGILFAYGASTIPTSYYGYKLFRLISVTERALKFLMNSESTRTEKSLVDVWSYSKNSAGQIVVDVLVAPQLAKNFYAQMRAFGVLRVQVLNRNLQRIIDTERQKARQRKRRSHCNGCTALNTTTLPKSFDVLNYNSYETIVKYLGRMTNLNPNTTKLLNITKSFEGRDVLGIKISRNIHNATKRIAFIDAGLHAREWIAPAAALYLIHQLVSAAENSSYERKNVHNLLNVFDFVVIPIANPDGYVYSMTMDRFWRKTRSRNATAHKWCVGADANRNWGYRWEENLMEKKKSSPCSNIFAGTGPFSEPEVAGLREFIHNRITNITVYVSLHAYGQLILSPWGWTKDKPSNHHQLKMAAESAIELIRKATDSDYHYGTIAQLMYPASGTSIDYMESISVPYVYGIELRPEDVTAGVLGFIVPPQNIKLAGEETLAALSGITTNLLSIERTKSTVDPTLQQSSFNSTSNKCNSNKLNDKSEQSFE